MRRSIACACGERTIAANVCLGSVKSSPNVPAPVIKRLSSRRKGELPIPGLVMVMFPSPHRCDVHHDLPKASIAPSPYANHQQTAAITSTARASDIPLIAGVPRCLSLDPLHLFSAEES